MTSDGEHVPSVEALVPYQSAVASLRRKLPGDATVAFTLTITCPAESYAVMIRRELESRPRYGIEVTVTALRDPATLEVESWRVHGLSGPLRLADLSEDEHHAIAGWAYQVAAYFGSRLLGFAYRV